MIFSQVEQLAAVPEAALEAAGAQIVVVGCGDFRGTPKTTDVFIGSDSFLDERFSELQGKHRLQRANLRRFHPKAVFHPRNGHPDHGHRSIWSKAQLCHRRFLK